MRRYKLRTPAAILIAVLLFGTGVVGLSAAPTCQRIIQKYSEKIAHHPISKRTLARWAIWNQAHPNFHPAKRRPRLTPKETFDKVNFACEVPLVPQQISTLIPPVLPTEPMIPGELITVLAPPLPDVQVSLLDVPPIVPIALDVEPTPEPSSILLLASGMALLTLLVRRSKMPLSSRRRTTPTAA